MLELINMSMGLLWFHTIVAGTLVSRVFLLPFSLKQLRNWAARSTSGGRGAAPRPAPFARQLSTVLATTLRAGANCTLGTVEQLTYDEYIRSLSNPSYLIVLSLNPLPGPATSSCLAAFCKA